MRDRLKKLLSQVEFDYYDECCACAEDGYKCAPSLADFFADYLLDNGVIVPPVKVGQTCYMVYMGKIFEIKVTGISYEPLPAFAYTIRFNHLGVLCLMADGTRNDKYSWLIFLTREEAEKELAERSKNGT